MNTSAAKGLDIQKRRHVPCTPLLTWCQHGQQQQSNFQSQRCQWLPATASPHQPAQILSLFVLVLFLPRILVLSSQILSKCCCSWTKLSCHAVLRYAMLLGRSTKQKITGASVLSMQNVEDSLWRVLAEHVVLQVIKQASLCHVMSLSAAPQKYLSRRAEVCMIKCCCCQSEGIRFQLR